MSWANVQNLHPPSYFSGGTLSMGLRKSETSTRVPSSPRIVSPIQAPSCRDREVLRARLRADFNVYREAVLDLQNSIGEEFKRSHQRAERARVAYEAASQTLRSHLALHCCE